MAFGELTKQLAQKAFESQVKDVVDSLSPAETTPPPKPIEHVGATILKQVQAMQSALKEEDELVVLVHQGGEALRWRRRGLQAVVLARQLRAPGLQCLDEVGRGLGSDQLDPFGSRQAFGRRGNSAHQRGQCIWLDLTAVLAKELEDVVGGGAHGMNDPTRGLSDRQSEQ